MFIILLGGRAALASCADEPEERPYYQILVGHAPSQESVRELVKNFKKELEEFQDFEVTIQDIQWKIDHIAWHDSLQHFYENSEKYILTYKGNGPYLPVAVAFMEGQIKRLSFRLSKNYSK